MKKVLLALLFCLLPDFIPCLCFSQVSAGYWQLVQGDPYPDNVVQVVAGSGSLVYMTTLDKGIFKSTDEGENWVQINTGLPADLQVSMLTPGPNGALLALDRMGNILYSKDAISWTNDAVPWSGKFPTANATAFSFDLKGNPYVGTSGAGIYQRNAAGLWQQVVTPSVMPDVNSMLFDNENKLFVSSDKLYRFDTSLSSIEQDWGITGTILRAPWNDVIVDGGQEPSRSWIVDSTTVTTLNHFSLIIDSVGRLYDLSSFEIEISSDRGVTWISYGRPNSDLGQASSYGFVGFSTVPFVSYDTGNTLRMIFPLSYGLKINEIDVDRKGTIQAFDQEGGIWSSRDRGVTWRRRMPCQNIRGTLGEDGKYYSASPPMVSEDEGLTYKPINVPAGKGAIYASPNGTLWFYYGSAHFMRSTDSGATWNEFAHITDLPPAYYKTDSAFVAGVIERDPYIWLATTNFIHLTSDDGKTWQVDTANYFFNSNITGGRGYTIITHTSGEGVHWLSPGESADSGWLQPNGVCAQDIDGTTLQFAMPYNYSDSPQAFIRESSSGVILDTLGMVPDSLTFPFDGPSALPQLAIDSFGNIFAVNQNSHLGLYRFVMQGASVNPTSLQGSDLNLSIEDQTLSIYSPSDIQSTEIVDLTGRVMMKIAGTHSLSNSINIAGLQTGIYVVRAETSTGTFVRKISVIH